MLPLVLHAALASAAVVGLEVVLPRVFSVVLWYHLGFFAVSLAMLGFAYGGRLVARRESRPLDLDLLAALAAAAMVVAVALVVRVPVEPTRLTASPRDVLLLFLVALLLAVPFVLLGAQVCGALERGKDRFAVVYGASFLGGALGAGLALLAMDRLGAPRALPVLALFPIVASLASRRREALGPTLGALVVVCAALGLPDEVLPMRSRKHFPVIPDERVIGERWNAFSRVTFYDNPDRHGLWALPAFVDREKLPKSIGVAIDSWAITSILEDTGRREDRAFFANYPPTLAETGAPPGFSALVIGAGGGVDVLAALDLGAGHVTAVEINPLIVGAVRGEFDAFSGGLYRNPRVSVHVAEGRRFVASDERKYDRIVLTGVDTFAATEAGAFALSENFLYTVEGMTDLLAHLAPGGRLFLSRWWFEPPRETLKLALTAAAALGRLGVPDARDRLFIAHAERNSLFLVKNGAFEAREVGALATACAERGAEIAYAPGRASDASFEQALDPARAAALVASFPYRIEPATDDRPFFFESGRWSRLFETEGDWIHGALGGQEVLAVTLFALLLLALPLLARAGRTREPALVRIGTMVPFLLLGFAFALVEIPLLARLALPLGHPVYAVSCVLVALLVMSGVGSLAVRNVPSERAPHAAFAAAVVLFAVLISGHDLLLQVTAHATQPERVVAVACFLAFPGFVMGMPLALAVRRLSGDPRRAGSAVVSGAFTANAAAAALAGPIAMALALSFGFTVTLACGALLYLLVAILLLLTPVRSRVEIR